MATVSESISRLRTAIKQYTDDSPYTDEYLYSVLNSAKSVLLRQRATKFNKLPNPQCFCMELIEANSHDCDCIDIGCKVLKTRYPVPETIFGRNTDLLYLKTLGETEIPVIDYRELSYRALDPIKGNSRVATELNGHYLIWNEENLKAIVICAQWADIADWADKVLCPTGGDECFDIGSLDFGIPKDLEMVMIKMAIEELGIPLSIKADITNDTNEDIKY